MRFNPRPYVFDVVLITGVLLLQVLFVQLLSVGSVTPDAVIIAVVVVALRHGHIPAMVMGFIAGLLFDLHSGTPVGLSALAKTVAGFSAGFFFDEQRTGILIRTMKFSLITMLAAFLHNLVFLFAYFTSFELNLPVIVANHLLASTLYTTVLSVIPPLILARTGTRLRL